MGDSLRTIIRTFRFERDDRAALTFSDSTKIMLDSAAGYGAGAVRLREDADGFYSLGTGLYVTSQVAHPEAARRLLGFQALIQHAKVENVQVTTEGFRLYDGTTHFFWNGSAWVAVSPSSSSWNTEAEVAANVGAFNLVPSRLFGAVVRLGTTDKRYTPVLVQLKFAYEARIFSTLEDMLYRSLARSIKGAVRPIADVVVEVPAITSSVDVGNLLQLAGTPFNLAGVEAIFNRTADPELLYNLLASYDSGTKVAVLTSSVAAGTRLQLAILHAPEVVVEVTHPDYTEVSKNPSYVIDSVDVMAPLTAQDDSIVNKADGSAIIVPAPRQGTMRFRVSANGPTALDAKRMIETLTDWATRNPLLRSTALDERVRLLVASEVSGGSAPTPTGAGSAACTMELQNVLFFTRPAKSGFAILEAVTPLLK